MRAATEDWLASAQDDLETVEELIDNDQLTHIVAFPHPTVYREMLQGIVGGAGGTSAEHS
jgi:hypothetical protein